MASAGLSRVHTGPVSRMEIEKWLGEEFEDGVIVVKLPTTYALALQMAVASSAIKPEDVPGDVALDDAQLLYVTALLQSIVDDVLVGTAAKDAGLKIGAADRMRFKKWMELRYSSEEDVMLETPSKALSEGEQAQLKADLNSQGMESLSELAWFTLVDQLRHDSVRPVAFDAARALRRRDVWRWNMRRLRWAWWHRWTFWRGLNRWMCRRRQRWKWRRWLRRQGWNAAEVARTAFASLAVGCWVVDAPA